MLKSKKMSLPGHVVCMAEFRNAYKILDRKREQKRLLGRPRCISEYEE
jgi:hypothetical protein